MDKPNLKNIYSEKIIQSLKDSFNIKNVMSVPKLDKIVLNMSIGDGKSDKNTLAQSVEELTVVSGQKAVITKAKKAISNFKIRENDPVGTRVTLRSDRMYEFLERFISIASPRIRDFRGLPIKGFDGRGNYNFGITEQIIFPEIDFDKVNKIRGMNITIVTTAKTDDEAYELLKSLGMPIKEKTKIKEEEVMS